MERNKKLAPLTARLSIIEPGLDSLCIATVAARLYDQINVELFRGAAIDIPVTIGDPIRIWETAFA